MSTAELDVLLHRIHWYLGQAQQATSDLVGGSGKAVRDNRSVLTELERAITGQRHAIVRLRQVLARRLLDDGSRIGGCA